MANHPSSKRIAGIIGALSAPQRRGSLVNIGGNFMAFSGPSTLENIAGAARGAVLGGLGQELAEREQAEELATTIAAEDRFKTARIELEERAAQERRDFTRFRAPFEQAEFDRREALMEQNRIAREKRLTDARREELFQKQLEDTGVSAGDRPRDQVQQDINAVFRSRRERDFRQKQRALSIKEQEVGLRGQEADIRADQVELARRKLEREIATDPSQDGLTREQKISRALKGAGGKTTEITAVFSLFATTDQANDLTNAESSFRNAADRPPRSDERARFMADILSGRTVDLTPIIVPRAETLDQLLENVIKRGR